MDEHHSNLNLAEGEVELMSSILSKMICDSIRIANGRGFGYNIF